MKKFIITGITLGCTFGLITQANCENFGNIDQPASVEIFNPVIGDFGKLRGLINNDGENRYVKSNQFAANSDQSEILSQVSYVKSVELKPEINDLAFLPEDEKIDVVITGQPYKTNWQFNILAPMKFDSQGRPMAHHQEYPRPSARSAAANLLEMMKINPYPGDE